MTEPSATTRPANKARWLKKINRHVCRVGRDEPGNTLVVVGLVALVIFAISGCKSLITPRDVRPLSLRDVPAQRLAYRFEADITPPAGIINEDEANDRIEAIQLDFKTRRPDDALIKTIRSPDGQRALGLYNKADEPSQLFHLDLYSSEGTFLRDLTPPDLSCVFPETVSWSPDGNFITFIAHKTAKPTPSPTPPGATMPETMEASPLPSVGPAFPVIPLFNTEQIYICNRDGFDLKPLTSREGLIYFSSSWAPDNHALVALACRESEWEEREKGFRSPAGRPRLITPDGQERLLDDELTDVLPAWSPDSSKVATAFETDVRIYDAATNKPTQAQIRLRDALVSASRSYEEKAAGEHKQAEAQNGGAPASSTSAAIPASFNPIVRMEWPKPEMLLLQTAYVRLIPNDPISTFQRWHQVMLSPQAAVLK